MSNSDAYDHADDHEGDNDSIHSINPSLESDVSTPLYAWPAVLH